MKKNQEIDKQSLNEVIHLSKNLLRVFYIMLTISIVFVAFLICKQASVFPAIEGVLGVISPLFIGFVIAWLFYPLHKKLVEKKFNKAVSAILIFIMIIAVLAFFLYFFMPILYKQVSDFAEYITKAIPDITKQATDLIDKIDIKGIDVSSIKEGLITAVKDFVLSVANGLPGSIIDIVKGLVSAVGTIIVSLIIGLYMLIDFENITKAFYKILPKKNHEDYVSLFQRIGTEARKVINGTLFVAFIVFVFDTIGFMIIGLNSSVLFGLFCGITDLIPYIGPYIGGAAAVIVGFTQGPIVGIGTLVIATVVQFLESYVLQPIVMSKAMQLNPVVIIVGLLVFAHFFGIIGMVVATPCMAIIKEIILFVSRKNVDGKSGKKVS